VSSVEIGSNPRRRIAVGQNDEGYKQTFPVKRDDTRGGKIKMKHKYCY
jgi:hypothetical protein